MSHYKFTGTLIKCLCDIDQQFGFGFKNQHMGCKTKVLIDVDDGDGLEKTNHDNLTQQCLALNRSKRERLARLLQESLEKPEPTDDTRFPTLYEIATDMFGKGILTSSRNFELTLGRRFIAYQMLQEGYSYSAIGRFLIRHHASVMHMCSKMEDVLRFQFKPEFGYWLEFQKRLKEKDDEKKV